MKPIWIISKRELSSFFDSLIAYVLLAIFLGLIGFFTWLTGDDVFNTGQASLQHFFSVSYLILLFYIPAITMRLLAEEKKTGTIELLLTKAISDRQVVVGKFLASFLFVCISLTFTLPYVATVASVGNVDSGEVICGYIGLLLMSAAYISIGVYISSLTSNQIVSFLVSLVICVIFQYLFTIIAYSFKGFVGEMFSLLSVSTHFESIARGVIDSKDLIYFLSLIFLGLFLAEISLSRRKISG